ncbi:hypothetical protein R1sor_010206 [Riccia sorocarpa]|uniref:Cytochrome P450 n=1 Tax=Riccia sorocarpa TaxID=122646 RepID=A0ABD3I0X1_9MARC
MVRAMLLPPAGQAHSPGLIHVLDLLERHCLAPDTSLILNSIYEDLLLAREEMAKERLRYFEAMKRQRLPPGPRPWPIIGNLHQLGKLPHHSLTKMAETYGPIVSFWLGSKLVVMVASPDSAREVLKTQDQIFASRPHTSNGVIRGYNRQNMIWAPYGPAWRFLRKVCQLELFTAKRIMQFQHIRKEEVMNLVQALLDAGRAGRLVEVDEKVTEMSANNMTRMIFNKVYFGSNCPSTELGKSKEEVQKTFREFFRAAGAIPIGDIIPFLAKLDLGKEVAKMWKLRRKLEAFFRNIIKEHRQRREANPVAADEDFVDVLLSLEEDNSGNKMTDEIIMGVLGDMLLAGTDTSADQVMWTLTELMRHPEIRSKLQQEIDQVVGQHRAVEESDLPQLKYLEAVVKESLRLHPVVPLLLPHENLVKTKVFGYDIPAQTRVYLNVYAIQRDPQVWENPLTFKPERFLKKENKDFRGHDFEFLPFGSGRRACPGMNLGLIMMHLTVAQMLHACEFSLPPGMTPEQVSVEETFVLTAVRAHPLQLLVAPRLAH